MSGPAETAALSTIRDLVRWGASSFARAGLIYGHGSDNALDEAFHLVLHALKLPFDLPATYLEAAVTPPERDYVVALLHQRVETRQPAAYLMGEAWFAGFPFHVDPRVAVPRSPLAELVREGFAPWVAREPQRILDLCTGSGCIGIAAALYLENAEVDCLDIDHGALEVCQRNIQRHGLQTRVRALQGDLFEGLPEGQYDLIVSNPPYVPAAEWRQLAPEYQREPRHALEAGEDGLQVVERILAQAVSRLEPAGTLICEVGGTAAAFDARYPGLPVLWPDFQHGGDGVFVVSREELALWGASRSGAG